MSKRNKIIYWIFTIWMSLGMVSTAIVQFINNKDEAAMFAHLGYPGYLMKMLAVWKVLGVIAALIPRAPVLKEWAYAGFFFAMSGAAISHVIMRDGFKEMFPSVLLLTITMISWYFRPSDRKCNCAGAAESPSGRRSLCYDREALGSRKEAKPANAVLDMAKEMGVDTTQTAKSTVHTCSP